MTHQEYITKLENIILDYGNRVLDVANGKENPTLGELVDKPVKAIQQLNEEAIGEESYWYIDDNGEKVMNSFNNTANGVKDNLKAVIGTQPTQDPKSESKHHLKPFEHKQPDDPSTHNALLQAAKEPTQDPKSVATVCSKCNQPFTGGTIQGNETATWHEQCPATKLLDEQIAKIQNRLYDKEFTIDESINAIKALIANAVQEAPEIYIPVRGYEGLYEVSNMGNIRSLSRGRNTGRILKQNKRYKDYLVVSLSKNNVARTASVHRIVAEAFLSNPENKRTVNHLDRNPQNNNISNLEWATHSENEKHAHMNGKKPWNKGRMGFKANVPRIKELESTPRDKE